MGKLYFLVLILTLMNNAAFGKSSRITSAVQTTEANKFDENKPYLIREFSIKTPGNLIVKTSGGSINVIGNPGNVVRVEMFVRSSRKNLQDKKLVKKLEKALDNYIIEISQNNNTISVLAESKKWGWNSNNNLSISFNVYVPFEISSNLKSSGGSININDIKGHQKISTSGGSIRCYAVDGNIKATTSGGSIYVENYDGVLEATTNGGSIKLKNANGNLKVYTSGGGISLHDVSGEIEAETNQGGITANVNRLGSYLTLLTIGGSIHAIVPSGEGLDLDLKGIKVDTELVNFNGKTERDKIVGSINGGGIPVKLSTTGGNVNLNFKN